MSFELPPYPYDRLDRFRPSAAAHDGGAVDLSVGTPTDPPPDFVRAALADSNAERGYPASIGFAAYREAAARWMERRFGVGVDASMIAACVGTKEFVGTVPSWLRLRAPDRDTVLYPAVSYPTYAMGALVARCRAVPVAVDARGCLDLGSIDTSDAERALCLWVNSPSNPTGAVDDLGAIAEWGRARRVPVFSDECYVEFTWSGRPTSILEHGTDGLVAVHSLSKRSNLAGLRAGFYAGDGDIVRWLSEMRKHLGAMVPGPVQHAAALALDDDAHVEEQRARYRERLEFFADVLRSVGCKVDPPAGSFYLWAEAPDDDAWAFTEWVAREGGALVSPGEFYGDAGATHVRVAMVQPMDRLELVADRLAHA